MKNYDLSIYIGKATVRIYIQSNDYKGYFDVIVGGNIRGKELLENAIDVEMFELDMVKNSNCQMKLFETSYYELCFSCVLKNKKNDTLEIDGDMTDLANYIVGCRIIDFVED